MKKAIIAGLLTAGVVLVPACSTEDVQGYTDQAVNAGQDAAGELAGMPDKQIETTVRDLINKSGKMVSDEVKCDHSFDKKLGGYLECASRHIGDWTPVRVNLTKNAEGNIQFDVLVDGKSIIK